MSDSLYQYIVTSIRECSTWLSVKDAGDLQCCLSGTEGQAEQRMLPCLTLVAYRSHGTYARGQQWSIPRRDLSRAVSSLSAEDTAFRAGMGLLASFLPRQSVYLVSMAIIPRFPSFVTNRI